MPGRRSHPNLLLGAFLCGICPEPTEARFENHPRLLHGHQDSIYARMVRYMAGQSTPDEDRSIDYKINSQTNPLVKIKYT